ncbi:hypothetical protein PIIN_10767 [Serendipita indica DSM 11827]|uniref:NB-ARC domain-containing protein n=1 Tax=Serendipita indica (strain DSM 11827) TaxID=1109443 RepID=G4TZN7_SERID|nr:hypothetical protein PIIN_10767 [Serendipita indica DSM 11827]
MVKFLNRTQGDYRCVLTYLKDWMKEAPSSIEKKWSLEDAVRATKQGVSTSSPKTNLPKPPPAVSRNYIERPEIQSRMAQLLLPSGEKRHQPRCILHGIGGAGKTQLAANWIRQHGKSFDRIIIVDATNKEQLEADLQRAICAISPEYANSTWEDTVAYLEGVARGWLLFFDNADSPKLDLDPYIPNSPNGATLITTRNRECTEYAPDGAIHIGGLAESEAVDLLHKVANITPTSNEASLEIVRELGALALAITQAGAYIFKTRQLSSYLATLRDHRDRLMRERPVKGAKYAYSTYAAFDLSFHQLPNKTQDLLKICAYFHHTGIPKALFKVSTNSGFTARTILENYPPPEGDTAIISNLEEILGSTWDEISFQDLIDAAQRASFINTLTDDSGSIFYSIHPLLQRYITDSLGDTAKIFISMANSKYRTCPGILRDLRFIGDLEGMP